MFNLRIVPECTIKVGVVVCFYLQVMLDSHVQTHRAQLVLPLHT